MKIAEPCPLIDPSQVVVTQGEILTADPVLTPIGTFFKPFFLGFTYMLDVASDSEYLPENVIYHNMLLICARRY